MCTSAHASFRQKVDQRLEPQAEADGLIGTPEQVKTLTSEGAGTVGLHCHLYLHFSQQKNG